MKVELRGKICAIQFEHELPVKRIGLKTYPPKLIFVQGQTTCIIMQETPHLFAVKAVELCRGVARCHENDAFVKETGRAVSLRKAITNIPFPTEKEERARFWKAYFERLPKQESKK